MNSKLWLEELDIRIVPSCTCEVPELDPECVDHLVVTNGVYEILGGAGAGGTPQVVADMTMPEIEYSKCALIPAGKTLTMTVNFQFKDGAVTAITVNVPGGKTAAQVRDIFAAAIRAEGYVCTEVGDKLLVSYLLVSPSPNWRIAEVVTASHTLIFGDGLDNSGQYLPTVKLLKVMTNTIPPP